MIRLDLAVSSPALARRFGRPVPGPTAAETKLVRHANGRNGTRRPRGSRPRFRVLLAGALLTGTAAALPQAPATGGSQDVKEQRLPDVSLQDTSLGSALAPLKIKTSGHLEQGYTLNTDSPNDGRNFGRLFDDLSNAYHLNQLMLTFERPLDTGDVFDWGMKVQLLYGSDARYTRGVGFMDNVTNDDVAPDIVELYANFHFPDWLAGGVDLKAGHFVTLQGAEVVPAPGNLFYSHSYIFNFGIPLTHTGVLATIHPHKNLDVTGGLVTGINTFTEDNNDALSFHGGVTARLFDDKVTLSPYVHIGPENPTGPVGDLRYIVDTVATVNLSSTLNAITDLNWGKDEGFGGAEWYGVAQYLSYRVDAKMTLAVRAEVWRDDDGFAAFKMLRNDDLSNLQRGHPSHAVFGPAATYFGLTLGANYKPYANWLIRPEVRYDRADTSSGVNGPFRDGRENDQLTFAVDVTWLF